MPERDFGGKVGLQASHHSDASIDRRARPDVDDPHEIRWESGPDCTHCDLRQQALFSALHESRLEHLQSAIGSAVIPVGVAVYRESEPATAVYTVGRGLIKLLKQGPSGERIVRLLGSGAAVGLEAYFDGRYRHTAVAMRPTELCRIPLEVLGELQRHDAGLAHSVLDQWQQQLESADRWLSELSQGVAAERIERLVAILAEMEEGGASSLVQLPTTSEVASMLGITRESVSRALNGLRRTRTLRRVAPHIYEYRPDAPH
jgi:CRP-like cAMP-binding protein